MVQPGTHPFPVTALTGGALGLVYLGLTGWVIARRRSAQVGIGDGEDKDLGRRIRVHGNFNEYVPLCLVLLAMNEAVRPQAAWVVPCAGALVVGRLLHAVGLGRSAGTTAPRFIGMVLTLVSLAVLAGGALWLGSRG